MNKRWFVELAGGGALLIAVLILHPGSWEHQAGARAKSVESIIGASFQVEVEGKFTALFKGCSGIGSISEVIENKVGTKDGKQTIQRIPGRVVWRDAVLSRGLTTDLSLNQWRQEVIDGGGEEEMRYHGVRRQRQTRGDLGTDQRLAVRIDCEPEERQQPGDRRVDHRLRRRGA